MSGDSPKPLRKTSQRLLPARAPAVPPRHYNLYPSFSIPDAQIQSGYQAIASLLAEQARLAGQARATIDGYGGVMWQAFIAGLGAAFEQIGVQAHFVDVSQAYSRQERIAQMLQPYLGGDDPVFGYRFPGQLQDFFDPGALAQILPDSRPVISIVYGCGAALAGWDGPLLYLDVPKNEIQFRLRAGNRGLLCQASEIEPKKAYKQLYFVDWPVLNRHKAHLLNRVDWYIDEQRPGQPVLIAGDDLRRALDELSASAFRVRPWFEPGPWGGQWLQQQVPQLSRAAPNYAWSFELISPENGILLESGGLLLEFPFDLLMFHSYPRILGDFAAYFGYEFPLRFDFLDTFDGGNLSIQCHPRASYIREHFGESFTQDECYYILDAKPGARVYLGFQDDIDPGSFRRQLEISAHENVPVDIDRFVNALPSQKHDLFLIPHGTVHGSGRDNLVLEISATPYIFTFKLYDWLRLDLDGKPRPLNIERAFANLNFERRGENVQQELVSRPEILSRAGGCQTERLPTHAEHFYEVFRLEFTGQADWQTRCSPLVMNLVEGGPVEVHTPNGRFLRVNYAETVAVPAAAASVHFVNLGESPARVVIACLKPDWFARPENNWLKAQPPAADE